MFKKIISFSSGLVLFFILLFSFSETVFAHDILQTLSKENMTTLQHNLINGGYLATSSIKTFGVYNSATEDAFNKWQIDRDKQYYANNNLSDTNTVVDNKATSTNWFVDFFKSVISFFKNVLKL